MHIYSVAHVQIDVYYQQYNKNADFNQIDFISDPSFYRLIHQSPDRDLDDSRLIHRILNNMV